MITTLLRMGTLAAWIAFLVWLASFGRPHLGRLLHPDLWWLVYTAPVVMALLLAAGCRRQTLGGSGTAPRWQWSSLAILLLPLVFFIQVRDARFDDVTFTYRSLSDGGVLQQGKMQAPETVKPEADGTTSLLPLVFDTASYVGKELSVSCQVLVGEGFPADTAVCYRYRMTCCAADAQPVFIYIEHGRRENLEDGRWVRARGTMSIREQNGLELPWLNVSSWEYTKEPAVPFLF